MSANESGEKPVPSYTERTQAEEIARQAKKIKKLEKRVKGLERLLHGGGK